MTRSEIKERLEEIMVSAMPDLEDTIKNSTENTDLHTDL